MITVLRLLVFLVSAAVRRIRWTRPRLDSGWDSWTECPLWTAGCFCGGGRPAGRGGVWAAGWGVCTGTVYQNPAEERKQKNGRQQVWDCTEPLNSRKVIFIINPYASLTTSDAHNHYNGENSANQVLFLPQNVIQWNSCCSCTQTQDCKSCINTTYLRGLQSIGLSCLCYAHMNLFPQDKQGKLLSCGHKIITCSHKIINLSTQDRKYHLSGL